MSPYFPLVACIAAYLGSLGFAMPLVFKLGQKGRYIIPFPPTKKAFIKKHGEEAYSSNKVLVDKILMYKQISLVALIGSLVSFFLLS